MFDPDEYRACVKRGHSAQTTLLTDGFRTIGQECLHCGLQWQTVTVPLNGPREMRVAAEQAVRETLDRWRP